MYLFLTVFNLTLMSKLHELLLICRIKPGQLNKYMFTHNWSMICSPPALIQSGSKHNDIRQEGMKHFI